MRRRADAAIELLAPSALVILVLLLRPAGLFVRGRTSVVDRV